MSFAADAFKSSAFVMLALLVIHALLDRAATIDRFDEAFELSPSERGGRVEVGTPERDELLEFVKGLERSH